MTRAMIQLVPRDDVLEAVAVVAQDHVARALADRLLADNPERLAGLTGLAGQGLLVVLGAADQLPWVDGVGYLGRDPAAPRLLIPTALRPTVAIEIVEAAMLAHAASLRPPLAMLQAPPRVLSVADALPLSRDRLQRWRDGA